MLDHTIQQRTFSFLRPRRQSNSIAIPLSGSIQTSLPKLPWVSPNPARSLRSLCEPLFHLLTPSRGSSLPKSTHSWGSKLRSPAWAFVPAACKDSLQLAAASPAPTHLLIFPPSRRSPPAPPPALGPRLPPTLPPPANIDASVHRMNIISSALQISSMRCVNHPGWSLGCGGCGRKRCQRWASRSLADAQGSPFSPLNYVDTGPKISLQRSSLL